MGGFIKLDKKILEWEWWNDINTSHLFIYCLLRANWKDTKFKGVDIPRGGFVTSLESLVKSTGLTKQNVRTAIKHLKLTGELTVYQHGKFSVVVVNNYDKYQDANTVTNTELTQCQHSANTVLTPEEEYKEYKELKEIKNNTLSRGESKQARFVPPTVEEVSLYCQERQNGITGEEFCAFYESKDWMIGKNRMKNWKAAVRTWESKRGFSYQQNKPHEENGQLKRVLQ